MNSQTKQIRAEIERRKKLISDESLIDDLDSIVRQAMSFYVNDEQYGEVECVEIAVRNAVIKAANWQKQQLIKDAVDAEVVATSDLGWESFRVYKKTHKCGDKLRLIIIKEE